MHSFNVVFHLLPRVTPRFINKANYTSLATSCFCQNIEEYARFDVKEVDRYMSQMFRILRGRILEIGIGTGPNLRYYDSKSIVELIGIDPNPEIQNCAGFPPSKFKFIHGVGEAIPLSDAYVDAVVGHAVLCSVKDVDMTVKEIKRVLRPGGLYVFVEHVVAKDRKMLRFFKTVLNPVTRKFGNGCQLIRDTGGNISRAGFSSVELNMMYLSGDEIQNPLANPVVYGMAYK